MSISVCLPFHLPSPRRSSRPLKQNSLRRLFPTSRRIVKSTASPAILLSISVCLTAFLRPSLAIPGLSPTCPELTQCVRGAYRARESGPPCHTPSEALWADRPYRLAKQHGLVDAVKRLLEFEKIWPVEARPPIVAEIVRMDPDLLQDATCGGGSTGNIIITEFVLHFKIPEIIVTTDPPPVGSERSNWEGHFTGLLDYTTRPPAAGFASQSSEMVLKLQRALGNFPDGGNDRLVEFITSETLVQFRSGGRGRGRGGGFGTESNLIPAGTVAHLSVMNVGEIKYEDWPDPQPTSTLDPKKTYVLLNGRAIPLTTKEPIPDRSKPGESKVGQVHHDPCGYEQGQRWNINRPKYCYDVDAEVYASGGARRRVVVVERWSNPNLSGAGTLWVWLLLVLSGVVLGGFG